MEISLTLKKLKPGKVSGVDGIPIEFYKVFWLKLKPFIFELFKEICRYKKLHLSARGGVIALLEKTGKDPLELENWRPISLLCVDYKIFAKIIALCLQCALPSIIHSSQTGFMKGRNVGENTLKMLALLEYTETRQESAVVVSFDFRKGFDKVRWEAIKNVLSFFGFGKNFIQIVMILYMEIFSTVLNNGYRGGEVPT